MGALHGYVIDTTAENLSARVISSALFSVYLFDKAKVRVGEDVISLSNVGPGETVRFETTGMASGQLVAISIQATSAGKTITLTVNSSPQGAQLKVDGQRLGSRRDSSRSVLASTLSPSAKKVLRMAIFRWKSARTMFRGEVSVTNSALLHLIQSNCATAAC